MSPFIALPITFALSLAWLRGINFAAQKGWIESRLSRKILHMGTGPLYVLCWLLFPDQPISPWLAALVPFAITLQFAMVGLGLIKDPAAVQSMSRTGDRREILRGPLLYGLVFIAITLVYWTRHPAGLVALMLLCGGDGLADIWGRKYGQKRLPWSPTKTWAGSFGMLVGGWVFSLGVLAVYVFAGVFPGPLSQYLLPVSLIALAGALVESLPFPEIDNLTVPAVALLLGAMIL
jgi:phytol kinase